MDLFKAYIFDIYKKLEVIIIYKYKNGIFLAF